MALKLRRGSNAQRLAITPEEGELIYTTDTKAVYIGDGSTLGGTAVTSTAANHFSTIVVAGQSNIVADSTADSLTLVAGNNISITTDASTDSVTINSDSISDLVFDTTPQLGGNLDTQGYVLTSTGANDVNIAAGGTGFTTIFNKIRFGSSDGTKNAFINIYKNGYTPSLTQAFSYWQVSDQTDATNFNFIRSRGTHASPTTVLADDKIVDLAFYGHSGSTYVNNANISVVVTDTVTSPIHVPGKFVFSLGTTSSTLSAVSELTWTNSGTLKVNNLTSYNADTDLTLTGNGTGSVVVESIKIDGSNINSTDSTRITIKDGLSIEGNLEVEGTLGFKPNIGGSVTQLTNKTTSVTLNRPCGSIQLASGTINAGDEVSFTMLNSYITDRDVVAVSIRSNASAGTYVAQCDLVDNGQCRISLSNISSSPIDQQVVLNFVIIKSVAA